MNICEIAKQMEREGERHYRELANNTDNDALANIFNRLADNEIEHYNYFDKLEHQADIDISQSHTLKGVRGVFKEMAAAAESFTGRTEEGEVYKEVLASARKAVDFYTDLLAKAESDSERLLIEHIMEEEKHHVTIMENLVEFLEQPKMWVENAEFSHLEDY